MWSLRDNSASSIVLKCLNELSLSKFPWLKGILAVMGLKGGRVINTDLHLWGTKTKS